MIPNPLADTTALDADADLVVAAQSGSRDALEQLVARHQRWIYNIVLRMIYDPHDAEDITQEILIKLVTKLSTFEGRSRFRTWLYRLVVNHVLNMKRAKAEEWEWTFEKYGNGLRAAPDEELPDPNTVPVDLQLLVEEAKIGCTTGMLLCLSREQRLVYILGEILGVSDTVGAELLDVSRDNFRQKLSRARRDLNQFMDGQCGLVNTANPCRCAKKTQAFIRAGYLDPQKLVFAKPHVDRVRELAPRTHEQLEALDAAYAEIHRDHPFHSGPDFVVALRRLLGGALAVALLFAVSACGTARDDYSPETIIALEKGALDRWGKGDPAGYYDIMAEEETYFDPMTAKRIDGLPAIRQYIAPFTGKITIERVEMIDPKVQRVGDLAVLTFNLNDYGAAIGDAPKSDAHWNSTEVYQRIDGRWKIVHSHWSNVKAGAGADVQTLRTQHVAWARAWAAKDLDAIVSHYADDADVELADTPIIHGKAAIRASVSQTFTNPSFALAFAPDQVEVATGGDLGYVRGAYTTTLRDPSTTQTRTAKGKYIVVYRREGNGQWKAVHDINNRDAR